MKRIDIAIECRACKATGLYKGMAERHGFAVVCSKCEGTGCEIFQMEYEEFTFRKRRQGVTRVVETNPGIMLTTASGHAEDEFGGMPYSAWLKDEPFPEGSENREFTCPAWWYQSADYDKKPNWPECIGIGSFSRCSGFANKSACWRKWDKEHETT